MNWNRMRFKGQDVWVKVDERGQPLLDGDGRAEMKYRQEDSRSYRPAPSNLLPAGAGGPPAPPRPSSRPRAAPAGKAPREPAGPEVIHIWTDGACTGNPGPMGIGVVVLADGARQERSEFLGIGTNNIAELTAIERGLQLTDKLSPEHSRPVRVYTDSAYSIGVISMGWKAKANQELVARLRRMTEQYSDLTFVKVAGHAGVPENERCDELARRAIETRGTT